jgi:hypothetical protein
MLRYVLSKYHNGIYKTYQYLSSLLHIVNLNELTAVHGAAVPFSVMTKYFTPRAGCYCSSRHKHGQLARQPVVLRVSYLSFVVALLTVKHQAGIKRTAKNKKLSERLGQTDTVL